MFQTAIPISSLILGRIHPPHLWIHKYFTDNSSVNFHDKGFLHSKIEEKPCHGNLRMSRLERTYGSVSEAGEFGLGQKNIYDRDGY